MQQLENGHILFSPTDLVKFLGCRHASFLDFNAFSDEAETEGEESLNELLQKRGLEHEHDYLQQLKKEGKSVVEIEDDFNIHLESNGGEKERA